MTSEPTPVIERLRQANRELSDVAHGLSRLENHLRPSDVGRAEAIEKDPENLNDIVERVCSLAREISARTNLCVNDLLGLPEPSSSPIRRVA